MVPRLWVPLIHSFPARNWNFAASGAALTASRVAKRVPVSTPLRVESLSVAVISVLLLLWWGGQAQASTGSPGAGPAASSAAWTSIALLSCFCSSTNSGTGG